MDLKHHMPLSLDPRVLTPSKYLAKTIKGKLNIINLLQIYPLCHDI